MRITILIRSTFSEKDGEKNYEYLIILWRKILPVITRTSSSYGVTHLIKKSVYHGTRCFFVTKIAIDVI